MKVAPSLAFAMVLALAASASFAANLSILVCSPIGPTMGYLDLDYAKELVQAGIEVDYTDNLGEVTWDRVKHYNALLVFMTPAMHPGEEKAEAGFIETVNRFVQAGGGVFLWAPENNLLRQVLAPFTEEWGAKLPAENLVESDKDKQGALTQDVQADPLYYTDSIADSPVSAGVKGIWYPYRVAYNGGMGGPLLVDDNWTVVVKASATTVTKPIDMHEAADAIKHPFSRPGGVTGPLMVPGLNPRWSVGLEQIAGYSKGFYGPGENRYRPVGLDWDGCAYIPLYPDMAENTHIMVGHPIVAGAAGKDLFIQVTKISDKPERWHVSVNNPTDKPVTVVLHQALDLPGLSFPDRPLTLKAGEYKVLQ
jgi:hypothetical protein